MLKKIALCCAGIVVFVGSASTLYAFQNVTPQEAYEMAISDPDVYLLDVRTIAEWKWVGHPGANKAVDPATGLPIGSSRQNLQAAVAGETHEYTDMYPGMAKSAREEGFEEIADWFQTLAKAERSHANRFQKALDALAD